MIWATWWIWAAAALVLGILEIIVPAHIFLGFAIGAAAMAAILFVGGGALFSSLALLLVAFAVVSVVAWLLLRRALGVTRVQVKTFDEDING